MLCHTTEGLGIDVLAELLSQTRQRFQSFCSKIHPGKSAGHAPLHPENIDAKAAAQCIVAMLQQLIFMTRLSRLFRRLPCEWTTPKLRVVHAQRPAVLMVACKLVLQQNHMHMVVLGLLYRIITHVYDPTSNGCACADASDVCSNDDCCFVVVWLVHNQHGPCTVHAAWPATSAT